MLPCYLATMYTVYGALILRMVPVIIHVFLQESRQISERSD